jgi:hypothetical protein
MRGCACCAGDQVGHLWWRVLNGELPAVKQPRLLTMLIGTNDLTAADCHRNETELLLTVPGIAARRACLVAPCARPERPMRIMHSAARYHTLPCCRL